MMSHGRQRGMGKYANALVKVLVALDRAIAETRVGGRNGAADKQRGDGNGSPRLHFSTGSVGVERRRRRRKRRRGRCGLNSSAAPARPPFVLPIEPLPSRAMSPRDDQARIRLPDAVTHS